MAAENREGAAKQGFRRRQMRRQNDGLRRVGRGRHRVRGGECCSGAHETRRDGIRIDRNRMVKPARRIVTPPFGQRCLRVQDQKIDIVRPRREQGGNYKPRRTRTAGREQRGSARRCGDGIARPAAIGLFLARRVGREIHGGAPPEPLTEAFAGRLRS